MVRDDLEAALAEQFDPDQLAVYGDYLQSLGDPRGELIALDLHEVDDAARRDQLIRAWLGDDIDLSLVEVSLGFIADVYLDGDDAGGPRLLAALLDGPGAPYLQAATLRGNAAWLRAVIAKLAERRHAWLGRLSVQATEARADAIIPDELAARFAAATPRLEQLEVWGQRVFGSLVHDSVRSLCVTGHDAVGTLCEASGARLSALTLLDLAFHTDADAIAPALDRDAAESLWLPHLRLEPPAGAHDISPMALAAMIAPERFPRLRRLDLSRNEPGYERPHYFGGAIDPFSWIARHPIRHQLTHLRLPSLRWSRQADLLAAALSDMPSARDVAIARAYRMLPHVREPPGVRTAELWPWPPLDRVDLGHELHADLKASDGTPAGSFELPMHATVRWLEQRIGDMTPSARRWWIELFEHLVVGQMLAVPCTRNAVLAGLAALDVDADPALADWLALREALQQYGAASHVVMRRHWPYDRRTRR
jgi:hypothetical protein